MREDGEAFEDVLVAIEFDQCRVFGLKNIYVE